MDLDTVFRTSASFWLVWLIVIFAGLVFWTYRPRRKKEMDEYSRIPLRDDDEGN